MTTVTAHAKPSEVEAILYTGTAENCREVHEWLGIEHTTDRDIHDTWIEFDDGAGGHDIVSPTEWVVREGTRRWASSDVTFRELYVIDSEQA